MSRSAAQRSPGLHALAGPEIEAGTPGFRRATLALCLGSVLVFAQVYLPQPLLPLISAQFELTPLQSALSLSLTTLALGLSLLVYGPLSDALGRRGLMLCTLGGSILTTLLISQVTSFEALLGLRMLQGMLLGGLPAVAIAYMGDEFSKRALVLAVGVYIAGNSLGGISGRLLGGFIGERAGWEGAFLVLGGVGVAGFLLLLWLLPRSRRFVAQPMSPGRALCAIGGHLRRPVLLAAYLLGGLNFFIFINQFSYITFVLAEPPYQLPPAWLGMLFLTYLAGTLGSALSGRVAQRLAPARGMGLGILILMLGTLTTLGESLILIVAGFLLNSFGFFFAHSLASSWVNRHAQGAKASASSLYLVFYYLGASAGGLYLELFWQWLGWPGVVLGSLLVLGLTLAISIQLASLERREGCDAVKAPGMAL